ncbi:MAG: transglutaminase family protein [Oscillospiraceae bacterium]
MDIKRSARLYAAAMALVLLSGCASTSQSVPGTVPGGTPSSFQTVGEPVEISAPEDVPVELDTGENGGKPDLGTIDTEEPTADTSGTQTATAEPVMATDEPSCGESAEPAGELQPTAEPEDVSTQPTQPDTAPVVQTTAVQTTAQTTPATTTKATTAQTTKATTAEKPDEPVKVVIPDVKMPQSPGTNTACADNGVMDYSNASDGYISVTWKDNGKMLNLRIMCGDRVFDHEVTAGTTEYFPLNCGSGTYTVQVYEQTTGSKYAKVIDQTFSVTISRDTAPYTYPNKYVNYNKQSNVVKKAAELCAGKTGTIEKIGAIFTWITENITYDNQLAATVQEGYVPDPDKVLAKRSGICYDYSSLFAAMARSQGIPTRLAVGYASPDIFHAWDEVYTEETGWVTPELLLKKSGYNLLDATFYAGYTDKAKAAAFITNSGNYSTLYYY